MIASALDLQADDIALSNFNEKYNCSIKAEKKKRNSTRQVKVMLLMLVPISWEMQESVPVSMDKESKKKSKRKVAY